ncbi:MAG: hypothetical protein JGK24_31780 [Microcoleus sp. PH2017_29_MFU_D_A]|uniref:FtsK/SpoIIIE domain-containing protein n=1 Tax=unclassified Microcoleus TaxID=2642155 RepID=UPI001DD05152|nr:MULTISPECIES: FtsK/SpoIIIE domain-containing protein [unclassified Microcoleus]TAE53014.1 MAG: hypothetical protein EAZ88_13280 [Oscillatoriales cyanobacterium]MCC3476252.1 hypothetical protein [Microcoleus sp. PH2017_13_LAR_U_A]MCC3488511.1 hypothetical protein [Microcoleus sp. PH2017_14_LAR_D_A]MCC3500937.1 hypothetical protein [Microcoleus sp. PH2017_15_JOR_U_A]MCC3601347.1 hypothetical protein [Microcoleus sp. PH2017_26_ELK_O_A]
MIYQFYPICLEIAPKRTIHDNSRPTELRKNIQQTQQQLISSISRLGTNLTISLRYIYDPNQSPKLKTYLLINHPHNTQTAEHSQQILSLLTKGKLSQFFTLTPQPNLTPFQNLDWVQTIGEILKYEEFIPPQNYYLPHLFEANQTNDMSAVCDVIHRLDSKLILEITLQTYDNPNQKSLWVNAINQMLAQLDKVNANTSGIKDNILSVTSALYQKYQQSYPNSDLFQYSIKALAENRADAFPVLDALIHEAIKETPHGKRCRIIQVSKDKPGFSESLEATKNVNISSAIEWEGWHKNNSEMSIANAIQPQKKGLGKFGGDSGSFPDKPSFYHQNQPPMIGGVNSEQNPNLPQLYNAVSDGSGLAKSSSTPPPSRMVDLKPLHRLATAQEISGFFRIAISQETSISSRTEKSLPVANAEDLFNHHRNLIDADTYIVGIDDEGNPVTSSWSEIAHRLVAGVPGAGKSNFLNWVIFQFIYANPTGKIYIADFAGVDFNFLVKYLKDNVEIVTTIEECQLFVEKLHTDEYQRRIELLKQYEVQNIQQLKKQGVDIPRTLWIIDEAAAIARASDKLQRIIENRLIQYANQGRKCGFHVVFCTQRPTSAIVSNQVLDSCEEKIVFRVTEEASGLILENSLAGTIPKKALGRAVLKGSEGDNIFVNTPFISIPVGKTVSLQDTLWRHLVSEP